LSHVSGPLDVSPVESNFTQTTTF